MAETLTYDPGTDTVTTGDALTPAEQESLEVGEALVEGQDQLLAGKYEDAQALEKAYIELQKKLGEDGKEAVPPEAQTETEQEEVLPETPEEKPQEFSQAAELITSASDEFSEKGTLTPETIEKFSGMSSQDLVNAYLDLQAQQPQEEVQEAVEISESDINTIQNSVGGEKEYNTLIGWAGENLNEPYIEAFDNIVESGNTAAIQLAIEGIKSQYDIANGYEGRMLSGKAPKTSSSTFRSQAEVVEAMSDPRYENDPAYRQDLIAKLDRSDIDF